MKLTTPFFICALLCAAAVSPLAYAQEQSQAQPPPPQAASFAPAPGDASAAASSLDTQGIKKYTLGPGDVLDVRVFGQPEMNWSGDIDTDGNISSLPFIETPIRAQCRTEKEIQKDIIAAYSQYLRSPQISVRVVGRNSHVPATVFGAVNVPQRVQMQRRVRLSELLTLAGGVNERANGTIQILHTEPELCPEPGEPAEPLADEKGTIPFKVYKIADILAGKLESNPVVRPGDIVTATISEPVYITGSVVSPQGLYLRENLTLGRALAQVGGVRKESKNEVYIYRSKPGSITQEVIKVDYDAIKKQKKEDILLQAYDIIEVKEAGIFSRKRFTQTVGQSLFNIGPSTISGVAGSLPYRVIY
ncbi:MAG: polysaccharide biosynthesis/export family protein [Pyrinomonadaceae bacterium]